MDSARSPKGLSDKVFTKKRALGPFLKRIFRQSYFHQRWVWGLVAFSALVAVVDAALPLLWYRYIDEFINPAVGRMQADGSANNALTPWAVGQLRTFGWIYLAFIVAQGLATVGFTLCAGQLKELVIFDLRRDMFQKLQRLPYAFYDRTATGWLTIRLTSDVDRVSEVISFGFVSLLSGVMVILASFAVMFRYSWQLATLVLVTMPLMLILSIRLRTLMQQFSRLARRLYSEMAAFLTENINGIEVNKALVQEDRVAADFRGVTQELKEASYRSALYNAAYHPVVVLVGSVAAAGVIYFGGNQVLVAGSTFTVGLLAAFFGYARMIFEPIQEITRFYSTAQDSLSAGERIFSLLDEPVTLADEAGATDLQTMQGDVGFEGVHFSYVPGHPVVSGLNLCIRAGESIALAGPTGEGKSTIINLICRFYEPTQGVITIDGEDYRSKTIASYRRHIGVILQTAYLFSGTVRDNIRYGKLDATDAEIASALHLIGAGELMERLDEEVGEEGSRLSGGEKQLIAFARVILKDPRILIMDEATASLDTLAEQKIQQGVRQLLRGRTSLIIAHRLSTIRHCDRILVIKKGNIVEEGSHEALLRRKGVYYALYTKKMRREAVENVVTGPEELT